jgi:sugar-specific transcriptional regulator TrmB
MIKREKEKEVTILKWLCSFLRTTIKQLKESLEHALKQNEELSTQIKNATKLEFNSLQNTEHAKAEVTRITYSFSFVTFLKDLRHFQYYKQIDQLQQQIKQMKEKYEDQIATLQEDLESVTVDKELAEEKYEQLVRDMDALKNELKILQLFKQTVEEKEEKRLRDCKYSIIQERERESMCVNIVCN